MLKEKVMEAGKLILPPGMQEELAREPDDTWRAYIRIGYSPFMAVDEWKNAL